MNEELLISKCRVKIFLRQSKVRVSIDFYSALDEKIREILNDAITRAKKNQRSTVMGQDI